MLDEKNPLLNSYQKQISKNSNKECNPAYAVPVGGASASCIASNLVSYVTYVASGSTSLGCGFGIALCSAGSALTFFATSKVIEKQKQVDKLEMQNLEQALPARMEMKK